MVRKPVLSPDSHAEGDSYPSHQYLQECHSFHIVVALQVISTVMD